MITRSRFSNQATTYLLYLPQKQHIPRGNTLNKPTHIMGSDENFMARKRGQKSAVLPVSLSKSISNIAKHESSSKVLKFISDNLLIIVLIAILHYLVTGNIIPRPIVLLATGISSPFTALFNSHNVPTSISAFTESKYIGSYAEHGITSGKQLIPEMNKYIFPSVEDSQLLRDAGFEKLFKVEPVGDGSSKTYYTYSPDYFEDLSTTEDTEVDTGDDKASNKKGAKIVNSAQEKAIKNFKSNGHRIYKGSENPEIVLVTAMTFERLDAAYLVKCTQNRVDYAYKQGYGVYSRWSEEFIPIFQRSRNDIDIWARLIVMREAMFAFPNAKWFWYLDENTLIMNDELSLQKNVLSRETLESIVQKNQPIIPDGAVKTYNNVNPEELSLIVTQTQHGLAIDNFIIKNDLTGRAILELAMDPMMRSYPGFRKDLSACLSHIVQWHPVLLSKTAIIPPRTINAVSPNDKSGNYKEDYIYQDGDLVVSFPQCKSLGSCESQAQPFWVKTQMNGKV